VTNYPNDPNQPGNGGEQPNDGSGYPQYGNPQGGQYGAPQEGGQYGAQPYGSPQYGAPQPGGPYGSDPTKPGYGGGGVPQEYPKATLILVLGILGFCCFIPGVVAIVMGRQGLQEIDNSNGMLTGRQKVNVGYILGIVFTVLNVIGVIARFTVLKN